MAEVIWHRNAVEDFESIQEYILEEFGEKVCRALTLKVFRFIDSLVTYPTMGSIQDSNLVIRGFVISRQTTILYKIIGNRVQLLSDLKI